MFLKQTLSFKREIHGLEALKNPKFIDAKKLFLS